MADLAKVELIECPYLPDGLIAMRDAAGIVAMNTANGICFRVPPIEFELNMPETFSVDGDRITGTMKMLWRFCDA